MSARRLKDFDYQGYTAYSVTLCCGNRNSYFASSLLVNECIKILKEVSSEYNFCVYVYVFMPDHLHLCLAGEREESDLRKMITLFKQRSGYYFKNVFGRKNEKLFQNGYYDHVIRKEEDIEKVARYIAENPLRKGLVQYLTDYPYLGSFAFDIKEIF